jgi:hypothetical protein
MRKGVWKEATATTVSIYRRNLQRAYIVRMEYLMKEEIKSNRSADYYNVAQSDVRFGKRRVNNLKNGIGNSQKQPQIRD